MPTLRDPIIMTIGLVAAGLLPAADAHGQSFTGQGHHPTDFFTVQEEMVILDFEHEGPGDARIRLVDREGEVVDEFSWSDGPVSSSRALSPPRGREYAVDVQASGAWTVRVRQTDLESDLARALSEAHASGAEAARNHGTRDWLGKGFVAGLLGGPVGTGLGTYLAGRSSVSGTHQTDGTSLTMDDPAAIAAFEDGYRDRVREDRTRDAIRGGIVGTIVFAAIIFQVVDLGGGPGTPGGGDGGPQLSPFPLN